MRKPRAVTISYFGQKIKLIPPDVQEAKRVVKYLTKWIKWKKSK